MIVWLLDLQLSMQSVLITTNESRTGEVYSIQHYVIKFVSYLLQVAGFLRVFWFLPNKTDCHDITEILLKVALNTINLTYPCFSSFILCNGIVILVRIFFFISMHSFTLDHIERSECILYHTLACISFI